jgi:Flp pilus assembly protein TadD
LALRFTSAISFVALAIVFVCLGRLIASPQTKNSKTLVEAQSALDGNHPQKAIEILSPLLKVHPGDDSARLLLAEALAMLGRSGHAIEQYQIILKNSPNDYIALAGLGELYVSLGEVDKAEPLLAKAVAISHEPELRIEWAQALARLHRFKEAKGALAEISTPPSTVQRISFFRLRAAIAEGLGDAQSAATEMEKALAAKPEDYALQLATAAASLQAGKVERATVLADAAFRRTAEVDAGLILLQAQLASNVEMRETLDALRAKQMPAEAEFSLRQHLAQILITYGKFGEAAKDLKRVAELNPTNPDLQFNLALAELKSGATKEALANAQRSRELRDNADVEALLGDIQEALGDNLGAVKSYEAAVVLAPNDENHHLALAVEFIRHRNFEPAKLVLEQAEKVFPRSWRIQVALGMVQYFVGTKAEASELMLRAVDLSPDPELTYRYLGDIELDESAAPDQPAVARICEYANAHPNAAREQLYCGALMLHSDYASRDISRVHEIVRRLTLAAGALPEEATPFCELGKVYTWLEDWKMAQQSSERCVKLNPDSAQAHYRLSQIYHHMGETERAREEIKLYKAASEKLVETNEEHESALNTFLYTIQKQATGRAK